MPQIDRRVCKELEVDEALLDVYVLQPEALSRAERDQVDALLKDNAELRAYMRELRAFYEELHDDLNAEGALPEDVVAERSGEPSADRPYPDSTDADLPDDPRADLSDALRENLPGRVRAFIDRLGEDRL